MKDYSIGYIIDENKKRLNELNQSYDPWLGVGSKIPRKQLKYSYLGVDYCIHIPVQMFELNAIQLIEQIGSFEGVLKSINALSNQALQEFSKGFVLARIKYDFEYWAATSFKIYNKEEGRMVPFVLNYPQRNFLLPEIERQRFLEQPIRINLLKARQWGGSTLIDAYIFYIQNVLRADRKWNSVIIGEKEKQAKVIRAMYKFAAKHYPKEYGTITLGSFEGTKDIVIQENNSAISVGSMQMPDGVRADDIKCAHMSELGIWKTTAGKSPEDLIQSVHGTLANVPLSFSAYESTAKGVGNFFHTAWLNSVSGTSRYKPVFVPWYIIPQYRENHLKEFKTHEAFIETLSEYEEWLWNCGATLEGIYWYRGKLFGEMEGDTWRMRSEFPTNAEEAFQSTGRPVFHPSYLMGMDIYTQIPFEKGIIEADYSKGAKALMNVKFLILQTGSLKVWSRPVPYSVDPVSNRYCVSLDIGGASKDADWSIITVIDRIWMLDGDGELEVCASAKFHSDPDLTVWYAAQVAKWYNTALFIPEANSMDKEQDTEGNHFFTVLDEIVEYYPNIFMRTSVEDIRNGIPAKYGFMTNAQTKSMVIDNHRYLLREKKFIEREQESIAEHISFEYKEGNKMGAAGKMHDDYVMSRAICSWAASKYMEEPKRVKFDKEAFTERLRKHKITGEASI